MANATGVKLLSLDLCLASKGVALLTSPNADPENPVTNVLVPDRYTIWSSPAPTNPMDLDLDLGDVLTISALAILNYESTNPSTLAPDIGIYVSDDSVTWGSPILTLNGTTFFSSADQVRVLVAAQAKQFWRFRFSGTTQSFRMAKIMLGTGVDLTGLQGAPGPGSGFARMLQQARARTVSGIPVVQNLGVSRSRYHFEITADDTAKTHFLRAADNGGIISVVTPDSRTIHGVVESPVNMTHVWGLPNLWKIDFNFEEMP